LKRYSVTNDRERLGVIKGMAVFLIVGIITAVVFFNLCVKIAISIKNNKDVGADKVLASTMLIICLYSLIVVITS